MISDPDHDCIWVYKVPRKSDGKLVAIKRIRLYLDPGHFNYMKEIEWLNEVNIMTKARKYQDIL